MAFIDDVKRHLKITWESADTDAAVTDVMSRATYMMNDHLGTSGDFETATGRDLDLYLNLCLYLYNGLTEDEFMDAYAKSLTIARQHHVDPINTDTEDGEDENQQENPAVP